MTDKVLIQECHDQLRIMFNPDVPLMQKLTARLAQPEPEPHGYLWFTRHMEQRFTHRKPKEDERIGDVKPLYTAPLKERNT